MAKNQLKWLTIIVLLLLTQGKLFAQLTAKFTASPVSGCAPIVVHFTDSSSGHPTQWKWDLGNGVSSVLQNPSTTYFNPGTYTIKLVIRNSSGADSVVRKSFITVNPNPVVNLKASDTTGCYPLPVQFTDLSSTASGTVNYWKWDFGDGTVAEEKNPQHTYAINGNFTVTLRVSNNYGCFKNFSKNQYIKIADGVKAGFTNDIPGSCEAPVTINFTNTSKGPGSLMYTWDFGDGTKSNDVNTTHTYTKGGSYSVMLVAVSPQGCRDTISKANLISVGNVASSFTSPSDICVGQPVLFTNTTTPTPGSVTWDFGDATTLQTINAVKTYTATGTYIVKLMNFFGGCTSVITKSVTVHNLPKANFSSIDTASCKIPFTVKFVNTSVGSTTYKWNFGDSTSSTDALPVHTYNAPGKYTVTLVAINANGCADSIVKKEYIKVQSPIASLNGLPQVGCDSLTIRPGALASANNIISSYSWNFGDGSISTQAHPTHTYTKSGSYDVSLFVTTISGCTDSLKLTSAIKIGKKPNAKFSVQPTDVCAFLPVNFTDNSTGNADQWSWDFGDGTTSSKQNPAHEYQDTGIFSVTLISRNNSCPDTAFMKDVVHIRPPIASFAYNRNCDNKYKRDFIDKSVGAKTWFWDFGDGTTSIQQNPSHIYQSKGAYNVVLMVSNGSCNHQTTQSIQIVDQKAVFDIDHRKICRGNAVYLTDYSVDVNTASWEWDFGDGAKAGTTWDIHHTYNQNGKYIVSLKVTDIFGCIDIKTDSITVYGPTAGFNPGVPGACLGQSKIAFKDSSASDGVNPINKWIWNFGDGIYDSASKQNFNHLYTKAGEYTVGLTVVDNFGCRDSISKPKAVIIAQPKAGFNSPDSLSCIDKAVRFLNTSTGYDLQYHWEFGDGNKDTATSPAHQYNAIGLYPTALTITDRYGCQDSLTKLAYINISLPKAALAVSDTFSTCPPLLVHFTNKSSNYVSLSWDFDDGNTSTLETPDHFYTLPGIYIVKLTATGPGGCTDIATQRIEIRGPRGSFSYVPIIGCNPLTATFTAITVNRVSFIWDFSDGTTINSKDSVITHTYTNSGDYLPKMILVDASGCSVPIVGKDTIKVVGISSRFDMDKLKLCNTGTINFTNGAISNDLITNYYWSFGDSTFSTDENPTHNYTTPGVYPVQFIATTQAGCSDTLQNEITVYKGPAIKTLGDSAACVPAKLNFTANAVKGDSQSLTWNWTFGNSQTASVQQPDIQEYNTAGDYIITTTATDNNGCMDSTSKMISIHPLPTTDAGSNTILCRDSKLQLNATGATTYSWNASPALSCTTCASPVATPLQTSVFYVTGTTEYGCVKGDSIQVTVRQHSTMQANPGDTICVGKSIHMAAFGKDKYIWTPATGLDNANSARPIATPITTTLYTVIGTDNDNCFTDTAHVMVNVNPIPTVDAGADITTTAGTAVQLTTINSNDVTTWKWNPASTLSCGNCAATKASPKQTTRYSVEVKNSGGCINSDEVTVSVICNGGNLFIPNTFSPNGDGTNDIFYPRGTGIAMIKAFRVFDRWGELLYEKINFQANDPALGWDGTYKGQRLAPDVYVYSCDVVCTNNEILPFKGDVTLLK